MLRKLLKYDLKSMFKYWWILALTSVAATAVGCVCNYLLYSKVNDFPPYVIMFLGFSVVASLFIMAIFPLASEIFIHFRFYKNFFTDEGYLTFTQPVKRSQLLNSKLISALITLVSTSFIVSIEFFAFFFSWAITLPTEDDVTTVPVEDPYVFEIFDLGFVLEAFALTILMSLISILFIFCCITFAAVITKKAKLITAIGIYYGTTTVLSGVLEIAYIFGGISLIDHILTLQSNMIKPTIFIMLLCIILFLTIVCLVLYVLEYFMLDRKLNLS